MEELSLFEELLEVEGDPFNIRLEGSNKKEEVRIFISPTKDSSDKDSLERIFDVVDRHGAHLDLKSYGVIEIYY